MKKKKIKVKIIIIVLIIILLLGVIVFLLSNRKESFKESITINIGDKIPKSNDYFTKDIKVKIKWASIDNYEL